MPAPNPYNKYRQNSVLTSSKEDLTLMLYEGALKFCNQAIIAIENQEIENAHNLIVKVQQIIREFQLTLNRNYEVSKNFDMMYEYIYRRLIDANTTKSKKILMEVRDLIREFRDMWKSAMLEGKAAGSQSAGKAVDSIG